MKGWIWAHTAAAVNTKAEDVRLMLWGEDSSIIRHLIARPADSKNGYEETIKPHIHSKHWPQLGCSSKPTSRGPLHHCVSSAPTLNLYALHQNKTCWLPWQWGPLGQENNALRSSPNRTNKTSPGSSRESREGEMSKYYVFLYTAQKNCNKALVDYDSW